MNQLQNNYLLQLYMITLISIVFNDHSSQAGRSQK